MAKLKSRPNMASRPTARTKRSLSKRPGAASRNRSRKPNTKHARLIALLQSAAGATIARMMAATDWQQHSVRGFLAGIVRKKLGLKLVSEQTDKGRVYRIKDGKVLPTAADRVQVA